MKVHLEPHPGAGRAEARTVGWAAQAHFLLVRIAGERATVVPLGEDAGPIEVRAPDGTKVAAVTTIDLPS